MGPEFYGPRVSLWHLESWKDEKGWGGGRFCGSRKFLTGSTSFSCLDAPCGRGPPAFPCKLWHQLNLPLDVAFRLQRYSKTGWIFLPCLLSYVRNGQVPPSVSFSLLKLGPHRVMFAVPWGGRDGFLVSCSQNRCSGPWSIFSGLAGTLRSTVDSPTEFREGVGIALSSVPGEMIRRWVCLYSSVL